MTSYVKLWCHSTTKKKILIDCMNEYLRVNPQMRGVKISQDKILMEIASYYLITEHDVR